MKSKIQGLMATVLMTVAPSAGAALITYDFTATGNHYGSISFDDTYTGIVFTPCRFRGVGAGGAPSCAIYFLTKGSIDFLQKVSIDGAPAEGILGIFQDAALPGVGSGRDDVLQALQFGPLTNGVINGLVSAGPVGLFANTSLNQLDNLSLADFVLADEYVDSKPYAITSLTKVPEPVARMRDLLAAATGVGPGRSLADKMTEALTDYAAPDIAATCAVLADFINEVNAQAGKKIAATDAQTFIADAQFVMTLISCK